jgi:crotonobetainyl-CoA:carnitine CoA-transferase CaiB-like acyl-CoA transferase
MCKALDVPGWDDPRVKTVGERRKNRDVLEPIMDMCYAMAANLTQADAIERFERERVAFAMVLSAAEMVDDPHAIAIGMFEEFDHPVVGRARLPRHPTQFHATPASLGFGAPALGQHTDEVLGELGLGAQIERLRAAGVVA